MHDHLDDKYLSQASGYLEKFTRKDQNLYAFRCPFCGDSEKRENLTRGYIFQGDSGFRFFCQNCTRSYNFKRFLQELAPSLYAQYIAERFQGRKGAKEKKPSTFNFRKKEPVPEANRSLLGLKKVSQLPVDHPCKQYVVGRLIPTIHHHRLYWCEAFKAWTNTMLPGKFKDENLRFDEGRLVMPLLDEKGVMFGYTGRAINPESRLRYIQIMLDEDKPKLYGLEKVNLNQRFYALEGGIDSLFLPNAIASAGGNIQAELKRIFFDKHNCVVVYDNEPRNVQIVGNMEKAIRDGFRVVFWPSHVREKDVNGYVLDEIKSKHIPTEQIQGVVEGLIAILVQHTYSGLPALLKLKTWKKC